MIAQRSSAHICMQGFWCPLEGASSGLCKDETHFYTLNLYSRAFPLHVQLGQIFQPRDFVVRELQQPVSITDHNLFLYLLNKKILDHFRSAHLKVQRKQKSAQH